MQDESNHLGAEDTDQYFVSLTDLMTGVVFIFIILLTAYALEFRAEKERARGLTALAEQRLKEANAAETKAQTLAKELTEKKQQLEKEQQGNQRKAQQIDALAKLLRDREDMRRKMLDDLVGRLKKREVNVVLDSDNGVIHLPESMLFDIGKADLHPAGRVALEIIGVELAATIRHWCPQGGPFQLESLFVEGHSDNVPIHNAEYKDNWELSAARAVNTSRAMTALATELIKLSSPSGAPILGVSGYGENRPIAANNTVEGRRLNRRIDIRFIAAYPTAEQFRRIQQLLEAPETPPP